ncbi:hypothetical protein GOODEAATRI_029879 [Goodea atripinnis]|uniref:Uncharacterized protein n=1 Tax=Goodea atripinnis TaxID=208336 RepID=A0ABV0PI70_9TELE
MDAAASAVIMVQLSPSHNLNALLEPKLSADGEEKQREQLSAGSPKVENRPGGLNSLQVNLDVSTAYHGYETYIEDGLICLKHKVRNLEKKKVNHVPCCEAGLLQGLSCILSTHS